MQPFKQAAEHVTAIKVQISCITVTGVCTWLVPDLRVGVHAVKVRAAIAVQIVAIASPVKTWMVYFGNSIPITLLCSNAAAIRKG